MQAAGDNDPEVQIRATDGLVNVYLPGYVKTGFSGTLSRAGTSVKGKFTDTNDQIIDAYRAGASGSDHGAGQDRARRGKLRSAGQCRAGAGRVARASGDADVIEGAALQRRQADVRIVGGDPEDCDPAAAPRVTFLLRDLEEKIRVEALETTGLLRNKDAAPEVRDALEHARSVKVRRAALEALAQIADPADRTLFLNNLQDKDDGVRAAAAEGLGRAAESRGYRGRHSGF